MSKSCTDCANKDACYHFEIVDANKCERYEPSSSLSIVEKAWHECREELKAECPDYTNITNLIAYLEEKSKISVIGRMSTEARVNKEALRLAAVYLQDYLDYSVMMEE